MKAFFADEQKRHDPKAFLSSGAAKPNPEQPERVERLLAGAKAAGCDDRAAEELSAWGRSRRSTRRNISNSWRTSSSAGGASKAPRPRSIPNIHPLARDGGYPASAVGQAGYHMADTACPISAETFDSACWSAWSRGGCGRSGAWRRAGRLCALPPARPPCLRRCRRRLLLPQQFGHRRPASAQQRRARRHPRRRPASRQRHAGDFLRARRRADRLDPRRPGALLSVLLGPCRRARRGRPASATISICRCRASPATTAFSRRSTPALQRIRAFAPDALVVALGLDAFEGDPFGGLSVTTPGFSRIGEAIAGAQAADRDRPGRRLPLRRARRQSGRVSERLWRQDRGLGRLHPVPSALPPA